MTKISSGGGVFSSLATRRVAFGALAFAGIFSVATLGTSVFGTGSTSGNVQLDTEIATSIAMKIASPNDTNPDCTPESGVTYGAANRYASSTGDNSGKVVDTFDGREGQKDEVNTNTSCATLSMSPNTYDSTYSDVTVYTNSGTGYALSVRSADNTSPNLVNTEDSTLTIPAGTLIEQDGTGEQAGQKIVPGGQNKWAIKTDTGVIDTWTAVTTEDQTVRAYDQATNNGDTTRVTYGISAGSNPAGKYATTLTYTATMFDGINPNVPAANIVLGTGTGTGSGTGGSGSTDPTSQVTFPSGLTIPYKETRTIPVTVNPGYEIDTVTCENGYDCANYNTGSGATGNQTIDITNNSKDNSGTITIVTKPIDYQTPIAIPTSAGSDLDFGSNFDPEEFTVPYDQSKTITVTVTQPGHQPTITCGEGYTCTVEEDQDNPGTYNITITNNTTTAGTSITIGTAPIAYPVSVTNNDPGLDLGDLANENFTVAYGESKTVTVTPERGHEVVITCSEGYACESSTATGNSTQDITITNNNTTANNSITITTKPIEYPVVATGDSNNNAGSLTLSDTDLSVPYGESKTITATLAEGYYLEEVTCANGYTCSATTGEDATGSQTITITNNDTLGGGSVSFKTAKKSYEVAITPSLNATVSTNGLKVPYGESRTVTLTPTEGYYVTSLTCSNGYTCSGYTTGSASNPSATSRGEQTITVTNNSSTNTGAVSFTLANTYRISFSKTNMSSPSSSYVDVAYGGSTNVTVTPASGYYLSAFSGCPSGWSCSGVGTGTGYTGAQTLTLTNNSSVNTGTLTMTGTTSDPWVVAGCDSATKASPCTVNGVQYIKLADGHYWTKSSQGSATWANASSKCPSGTTLPSRSVFDTLISKYSGGGLYSATGWSGSFWSATEYASDTSLAWYLYVYDRGSGVNNIDSKTASYDVVCVH